MKNLCSALFSILALVLGAQLLVSCESEDNDSKLEEFANRCREAEGAEVCNHKYALCIAASCDSSTMTDTTIECGHCDTDDGSCGYCYVFEGKSCSYNEPCSDVKPSGDVVYSTYSEVLSTRFGFDALKCTEGETFHAGCMDAPCTLTGDTVLLTDMNGLRHQIPTAICTCEVRDGDRAGTQGTLGGQCGTGNCSGIWSTADDHARGVLDIVPQCSEPN